MRIGFAFGVLAAIYVASSCLPKYEFVPVDEGDCHDDRLNGRETDTDCGGLDCAPCDLGQGCRRPGDCILGSCEDGLCQERHCTDQTLNDGESNVDCGGAECPKCGVNQTCNGASDCRSNACDPDRMVCLATGCDDGFQMGDETGMDCGGGTCLPCAVGKGCDGSRDCETGICYADVCRSGTCENKVKDEDEEGVDCGRVCPKPCGPCDDGTKSPGETDVDCGGPTCVGCEVGDDCDTHTDCKSNACVNAKCVSEACAEDPQDCMGTGGRGGTSGMLEGGGGSGALSGDAGAAVGGSSGGAGTSGTGQGGATGGSPSGGTATGGTLGEAGTSGGGISMGGGGMAGDPPLTSCSGCARLVVPLTAEDEKANFVIQFDTTLLAGARITFRVYKEAGSGGSLRGYIQHGRSEWYAQLFQPEPQPLSALAGWTEFTWDISAEHEPQFPNKNVSRVGIQISAAGSTVWTNPTIVYVDSIRVTNANIQGWTFDTAMSVSTGATLDPPQPGNILWRNLGDNSVEGSRVEWLGP